jgi:uncharacterized protein (DUF2164 family)
MAENNLIKYVCTVEINYLNSIDNKIKINKTGKYYYNQMFQINKNLINNFILNLNEDKLYVLIPLISISCKINYPYITLSRQIMISKYSNHNLITEFLNKQLNIYYDEIGIDKFDDNFYNLIFKYKSITFEEKTF